MRVTELIKRTEAPLLSGEAERGWESWTCWVWRRAGSGGIYFINVYKYLKEECKEDGAKFLSVVTFTMTRATEHKLEHRRFLLNTRKHFCAMQVTGTGCLEKLWILLLGDLQKPSGHACGHPAWVGVEPVDLQRSLPASPNAWVCDSNPKTSMLLS